MKIAIVCCLHGDEKYGLEVIKKFPSPLSFIGNELALKRHTRFIDTDMNRCFPGKIDGNYEEQRAFELNKKLKDFDYVIDLHSSSNPCPLFGIITKPNQEKIELVKKLRLKKLVIMPKFFASGKALIDFMKCGISLEIGPHERKENIDEVTRAINNLLENKQDKTLEIFEVVKMIKKEQENVLINNFQEVKKGQIVAEGKGKQAADFDFIPVLVNEKAYEGTLCLACKSVEISKFININEIRLKWQKRKKSLKSHLMKSREK